MTLFAAADRKFAHAVSQVAHCNPFLPTRIERERIALGDEFDPRDADWNLRSVGLATGTEDEYPNVRRLLDRSVRLLDAARGRLARGVEASAADVELYQDVLLYGLYHRHRAGFERVIGQNLPTGGNAARRKEAPLPVYEALSVDAQHYLRVGSQVLPLWHDLPHVAAGFFQIRRAFRNIFYFIIGASRPTAQLRAAVWQSIFTHDLRRYRRVLYDRMSDYTTLVTGPSGTGKELVARAVGLSRYIPFDQQRQRFAVDAAASFLPLNLAALSPTLIESELFGHRRGAFTGAVEDRTGWLELCPPTGSVFLDEIGELQPALQVKLLRVLQDRGFSRLGETQTRHFQGKLIAATHRNLAAEMRGGQFREDLYYRLCSDIIEVPSLQQRLADHPAELRALVQHICGRLVDSDAEAVTQEVLQVIESQLGPDYRWPGNVRELEQCVRNVVVHCRYQPPRPPADECSTAQQRLLARIAAGELSAAQLLQAYCTLVYAHCGSYEAAGRRLGLDRRTVKANIDASLLAQLQR